MTQRVLRRLGRTNPTVVFLAVAVLMIAGLALPGVVGGVLLLVLAAGAGWVLAQTWPVQPPRTRGVRLLILAGLVAIAVAKVMTASW